MLLKLTTVFRLLLLRKMRIPPALYMETLTNLSFLVLNLNNCIGLSHYPLIIFHICHLPTSYIFEIFGYLYLKASNFP